MAIENTRLFDFAYYQLENYKLEKALQQNMMVSGYQHQQRSL